ncbi:MAG TPA: TOBE domain-containing protein [Enterococcus sp.]|nr:TOBE domain-containing protein [Enterococcus sp.]HPR81364.1 TOBE domain-containing protein [Enterococcus sp.]
MHPEDIQIVNDGAVKGNVVVCTFLGKSHQYEVVTELGTLLVNGSDQQVYQTGEEIQLNFPAEKLFVLER